MTGEQGDRVIRLLEDILAVLSMTEEPAREFDDHGRCLHPDEQRVSLGRAEWICRRCKFQSSGVDHAQASV